MIISQEQLTRFAPASAKIADIVTKWFNQYNDQYEVNTPLRIAAFLAQVIHESGSFKYTRELATGDAYEGRKDLGNIYPGDGRKYKGHGYIQTTGRTNHAACSKALLGDEKVLLDNPELLCVPQYAMQSALWFWSTRSLNVPADKQQIKTITKRINGGVNGFENRVNIYNKICVEFNLPIYKILA